MQWKEVLTIVTITVGSTWAMHTVSKERIDRMDERYSKMDDNHRKDIKSINNRFTQIDEKWERLFEKLLVKECK